MGSYVKAAFGGLWAGGRLRGQAVHGWPSLLLRYRCWYLH